MYQSLFPRDIFAEMDRLQREIQQAFELEPSIRGGIQGGFPAMNIGSTPQSLEMYLFMPGLDPDGIDVNIERGVLTIAGERPDALKTEQEQATVHINERFAGRFKRVVSLPDDIEPDRIAAQYRDGVLHMSIPRSEAAQPRRISVH